MNPEDGHAADFARKMSSPTSSEYINLSGLMCWDAVMYCTLKAGIIDQKKYDRLRGDHDLVTLSDFAVAGQNAMSWLQRITESWHAARTTEGAEFRPFS